MQKIAIQLYLDPEQNRALTYLSKLRKRSKAAIIRECIESFLAKLPPEEDPILRVVGLGDSGHKDLSEKHDEYLSGLGSLPDGNNLR
ncbi:MAG: CopG family transcriptional regulator [bacterium]